MSMRFGNVTGLLFLLICVSAPAMAQERLRNSKLNATQTPARSVELGESWMDNADERELIQFLGLQPHEINPVQMMMRIDNDGPTDDDHGGGGGGGNTGPTGVWGVLPSPSPILSQNRWGAWRQVANVDLGFMLDETWLFIEGAVIDGIQERLTNTHRELTGPDLRGFYDINIATSVFTSASKRVYVWPEQNRMRLTWSLPNNSITCRANLNNWPDRDVTIITTINLVVEMRTTGNRTSPTEISASYITFSNTQASNDGILHEDAFNHELQADFNTTYEEIPTALPGLMFSQVNARLAPSMATTTTLKFAYESNLSRLVFRLHNPTISGPIANLPSTQLSKARAR
jgi:hypothetical protein